MCVFEYYFFAHGQRLLFSLSRVIVERTTGDISFFEASAQKTLSLQLPSYPSSTPCSPAPTFTKLRKSAQKYTLFFYFLAILLPTLRRHRLSNLLLPLPLTWLSLANKEVNASAHIGSFFAFDPITKVAKKTWWVRPKNYYYIPKSEKQKSFAAAARPVKAKPERGFLGTPAHYTVCSFSFFVSKRTLFVARR